MDNVASDHAGGGQFVAGMIAKDGAVDPFAPLSGKSPAPTKAKKDEAWEPMLPAPAEPPNAEHIRHIKYGAATRRWVFRDANGAPLFAEVRFDFTRADGTPDKEIYPYTHGRYQWTTPAGKRMDKTAWHFKRAAVPVSLYGLDRLAARPDADVLLCEGAKSADAAGTIFPDLVVIAAQGGAKAPQNSDWSAIVGRRVVTWPDADPAGIGFANTTAELIHEAGAASIRIVSIVPSEWPDGWDLADDLPPGVSVERLRELLNDAQPPSIGDEQTEEGEPDPKSSVSPEARAAEIDRLSRLLGAEYAAARKQSAQALLLGVGELDKLVGAQKAKRRGEAEAEHRAKPAPAPGTTVWPLGVLPCGDGLYFDTGDDAGPLWLCSPIEVMGEGRDTAGEGWGIWLQWPDADQRIHSWLMPKKMLMVGPGELEAALVDRGLRINADGPAKGYLRFALNGVTSGSRVSLADTPGWCSPCGGKNAFVLIDNDVIGSPAEHVILKSLPENAANKMVQVGTLEAWKTVVAAKATGNPVAAFAICAAFAGPLLGPLSESSGGFHFYGKSKAGKTLALRMGLSVWGSTKKDGLLKDWRSTANALEGAAEECNDGLLALDEIHQARAVQRCRVSRIESAPPHLQGEARRLSARGMFTPGNV